MASKVQNNNTTNSTPSWHYRLISDFKTHKEQRIQQITGLYMTLDIIGHIINVGLSAFHPALYTLNIILFTTTLPGQLYNLLLFSTYCLHGTNGLTIIVKDYHVGKHWQPFLIRLIQASGLIIWALGFAYLTAGYLGLGFGVPPIA